MQPAVVVAGDPPEDRLASIGSVGVVLAVDELNFQGREQNESWFAALKIELVNPVGIFRSRCHAELEIFR